MSQIAFRGHTVTLMQGPFFLRINVGIELRIKHLNESKAVGGGKSTRGLWCEMVPCANPQDSAASSTGKDTRVCLLLSFLPLPPSLLPYFKDVS